MLPPPFRQGFVYQGIKPAVLPVDNCPERVLLHVRQKQEELLEKLKFKRQQSVDEEKVVEPTISENSSAPQVEEKHEEAAQPLIEIEATKVDEIAQLEEAIPEPLIEQP